MILPNVDSWKCSLLQPGLSYDVGKLGVLNAFLTFAILRLMMDFIGT